MFLVYLHHLATIVTFGDNGDLLAAGLVKGVAHPSGYPLLTILEIISNSLPIPVSAAWKMNIWAAVFSAATVVLVYFLAKTIFPNRWYAAITSLTTAFIYPFWQYAEYAEVFPLYNFFVVLLLFMAIKWYQTKSRKLLYLLALFFGLALTNNETIILVSIPIAGLLLAGKFYRFVTGKIIFKCILLFVLGLSPYIYISIAAAFKPAVNWDNVTTWPNFIRLISRQDYGWTLEQPFDFQASYRSLQLALRYWVKELTVPVIFLGVVGLLAAAKKQTYYFFLPLTATILLTMPVFIFLGKFSIADNFDFAILERFLTIGGVLFLVFLPFGLNLVSRLMQRFRINAAALFIFIPIYFFIRNNPVTDFHNLQIGRTYAEDLLTALPPSSILFPEDDTPQFNVYFLQLAEKIRMDVKLITPANPESYNLNYIPEVTLVESRKPYLYLKYFRNCIPYGLVCKMHTPSEPLPSREEYIRLTEEIFSRFHMSELVSNSQIISQNSSLLDIKNMYALAFINAGQYLERQYQDPETAKKYYARGAAIDPTITEYVEGYYFE